MDDKERKNLLKTQEQRLATMQQTWPVFLEMLRKKPQDVALAQQFMSEFYNYSLGNMLLIMLLGPVIIDTEPTLVASYDFWATKNRSVKKGSKGIPVIARKNHILKRRADGKPIPILDGNGNQVTYRGKNGRVYKKYVLAKHGEQNYTKNGQLYWVNAFTQGYVYDVSQTEGEPIPKIQWPDLSLIDPEEKLEKLKRAVLSPKIGMKEIITVPKNEWSQGAAEAYIIIKGEHPDFKKIFIKEGANPSEVFMYIVHEAMHGIFDTGDRRAKEKWQREARAQTGAALFGWLMGMDGIEEWTQKYVNLYSDESAEWLAPRASSIFKNVTDLFYAFNDA